MTTSGFLRERILRGIRQGLRLVIGDVAHAEELEDLEQELAIVTEGDRAVVRVALLNEHMAIEAAHFGNCEDADAAERAGLHRQNLALGDVTAKHTVRVALQAVERDLARREVGLQRTAGEVRLGACRLEQTVLDELVFDRAVGAELAGRRVAAVESHEGISQRIVKLALDFSFIQAGRDRVVDIEKRDCIV